MGSDVISLQFLSDCFIERCDVIWSAIFKEMSTTIGIRLNAKMATLESVVTKGKKQPNKSHG